MLSPHIHMMYHGYLRLNAELISPSAYLPLVWRMIVLPLPPTIAQMKNLKDVTDKFLIYLALSSL